ncbi:hypothetical protein L202_06093 [Cryptococcus amylolentus CBS 6039]|uniref:tRNA-splicing endonuclease subunit Sen54 N-terminal domain-containing protein n=1 Tax=Cryptococcus amylolentus CBS 6039 TaxID=1295533 RepID=A0A1E3HIL5_9TREE|nr:hypothetical protein L202_06093 [Cryptococcus amylolentus CBS 6039]ODN76174.1 hypothetical protein L202_06093 [Cryptococcus amylolentus CBS 6039]
MEQPQKSSPGPSKQTPKKTPAKKQQKSTPNTAAANDGENSKAAASPTLGPPGQGDEEDEGEERMDLKVIQSFADKIQHIPLAEGDVTSRPLITIPKRGEKDFEPLAETVNLQEMMLDKSRQALFTALQGVRGGHSNSMSHALLTPASPYPRVLIVHGHLFDAMGITVRHPPSPPFNKPRTVLELLPEEALYLLERGTLQIWLGNEPETEEEVEEGVGEWCEEEYGIKGAVEMSVMEGFGAFIGREGLTLERYQAYAYLKRLGYNVQRSRRFIPEYFLASTGVKLDEQDSRLPPFHTWWLNIPKWFVGLIHALGRGLRRVAGSVASVGLGLGLSSRPFKGTLLESWKGTTYPSIFQHLRFIPAGHSQPLPPRPLPPVETSIYSPLEVNPYIPFWHIWKPMTPWSKKSWEKGSDEGLKAQRPDYFAAVIRSRDTPLPTIHQLEQIFESLPDEPKGPVKRTGPQYQRLPRPQFNKQPGQEPKLVSRWQSLFQRLGLAQPKTDTKPPFINIGALRNGDRGFIVGVNDSGNNAWIRFGRTGFEEMPAI